MLCNAFQLLTQENSRRFNHFSASPLFGVFDMVGFYKFYTFIANPTKTKFSQAMFTATNRAFFFHAVFSFFLVYLYQLYFNVAAYLK